MDHCYPPAYSWLNSSSSSLLPLGARTPPSADGGSSTTCPSASAKKAMSPPRTTATAVPNTGRQSPSIVANNSPASTFAATPGKVATVLLIPISAPA